MRFLLFLLSCFIPSFALAADATTFGSLFTPTKTDLSVKYLADIYGAVDGVLYGTGSQLFGTIFGIFNSAVLAFGSVIVMYILLVGTLRTAHEGEMLGKNWSSMWIPLRAVAGVSLIVPKATGYCMIQIFVMWVVVQGIGAADTVWNTVLDYLAKGGPIIQQSPAVGAKNKPLVQNVAGNIFKLETCMAGVENAIKQQAIPPPSSPPIPVQVPSFFNSLKITGDVTKGKYPVCYPDYSLDDPEKTKCLRPDGSTTGPDHKGMIFFPGEVEVIVGGVSKTFGGSDEGNPKCGSISWNLASDPKKTSSNSGGTTATDSRSVAMQQVVLDLQSSAKALGNAIVPAPPPYAPPLVDKASIQKWLDVNQNPLIYAGIDYMVIIRPFLNILGAKTQQDIDNSYAASRAQGWLLAGSYYRTLASISAGYSKEEKFSIDDKTPATPGFTVKYDYGDAFDLPFIEVYREQLKSALDTLDTGTAAGIMPGIKPINQYVLNEADRSESFTPGGGGGEGIEKKENEKAQTRAQAGIIGSTFAPALTAAAIGAATGVAAGTAAAYAAPTIPIAISMALFSGMLLHVGIQVADLAKGDKDPILAISEIGVSIVNWVDSIWFVGLVATMVTTLVVGVMSACNPTAFAVLSSLMWFLPIFMTLMFLMFAAGAVMAYYVPLIPFILFLFTAIGWFIAVTEAMVAAPLVALGIAHPEGHEVIGSAQPAIMLLAGVFMRPALITIGFLVGLVLSRVALWVLNSGIATAMGKFSTDWLGISMVMFYIIYVWIIVEIIERCFAAIHEVPSRVLSWVGGTVQAFGEAEAARAVKGGAEAGAGAISSGAQAIKPGAGPDKGQKGKKDSKLFVGGL